MSVLYENDDLLTLTGGTLHPGSAALTLRALEDAALPLGARVLDIGCGAGASVGLLRRMGFDAWGIDASERLVSLADSPYVSLGDGRRLTGGYDALLLECVLSLLGNPVAFLWAAAEALPAGGKLILCEPYRKTDRAARATRWNGIPDRAGYHLLFENAGFACAAWRDESDALKSFIAMLIMAFGSADAFLCEMKGGSRAVPPGIRLGYAASVWEKL